MAPEAICSSWLRDYAPSVVAECRILKGWTLTSRVAMEGSADGSCCSTRSVGGASSISDDLSELDATHDCISLHGPLVSCLGLHASALLRKLVLRAELLWHCVSLNLLHVLVLPRGHAPRLYVHALRGALHRPTDPARFCIHANVCSKELPLSVSKPRRMKPPETTVVKTLRRHAGINFCPSMC